MSLLREIQTAAASSQGSVADLLRKGKILAARLKSPEFATWLERELNGYADSAGLPDYRIASVQSLGYFVGVAGAQIKNAPIPPSAFPKQYRDALATERFISGITVYESLLTSSSEGSFEKPWPTELLQFAHDLYDGYGCLKAWKVIPRGAVVRLVDTVRNKMLAFALDIERENPSAGEALPAETPVAPATVSQVFHSHFYGSVGNIASGSSNFSQEAILTIGTGDISALEREVTRLGVPASEVHELTVALAQDKAAGERGLGQRAAAWLGKAIGQAASGAWSVSLSTATSLLPRLIAQVLGLPPS